MRQGLPMGRFWKFPLNFCWVSGTLPSCQDTVERNLHMDRGEWPQEPSRKILRRRKGKREEREKWRDGKESRKYIKDLLFVSFANYLNLTALNVWYHTDTKQQLSNCFIFYSGAIVFGNKPGHYPSSHEASDLCRLLSENGSWKRQGPSLYCSSWWCPQNLRNAQLLKSLCPKNEIKLKVNEGKSLKI